jgi:DNA-binding NtrC family response regulator
MGPDRRELEANPSWNQGCAHVFLSYLELDKSQGGNVFAARQGELRMADLRGSPKVAVLIVEDEPLLRMVAAALIEEAGFEPLEARNANHALSILEARPDIRIVFTDINLPGSIDGLKFAEAIGGRWPSIKIILTSGYYYIPDRDLPPRSVFIRKPYNFDEVVSNLQRIAE